MRVKVSELTGAALDWAVAKCEEYPMGIWYDEEGMPMMRDDEVPEWKPSTDWSQGGPIIERERVALDFHGDHWTALMWWDDEKSAAEITMRGPTPLIAAMRCYVASRLGDEVDVPDELVVTDHV